jgi:hypothetical protein
MKKFITMVITVVLAIVVTDLAAQHSLGGREILPLKSTLSPVYGPDVLIDPNPAEDQVECRIAVASNGWIYAAYIIRAGGFRVARSVDGGTTWTYSSTLRPAYTLTAIDLAVTGADSAGIKVWIINTGYFNASIDMWDVDLQELDGNLTAAGSYTIDSMISNDGYYGAAIATDQSFPSAGTNPYSLAVLFSKGGIVSDEVVFKSSSTGNAVFDNTKVVGTSTASITQVALAYGRSYSFPEGRYFAAWHVQPFSGWAGDYEGEIYTSFTPSAYNGSWILPIRVDNLVASAAGRCKHPAIACQVNNTNNISSGISTVLLFDRVVEQLPLDKNGVVGVYNLDPLLSSVWTALTIESSLNVFSMQPDITFDSVQNIFYSTWCDSTSQHLKCSSQLMDMPSPSNWTMISSGYNDIQNTLIAPYPKVRINSVSQELVHVWGYRQSSYNDNVVFDGTSVATGVPAYRQPSGRIIIRLAPNPVTDVFQVSFEAGSVCMGNIRILDQSGQTAIVRDFPVKPGQNSITISADGLPQGLYFCALTAGSEHAAAKLVILR